MTNLTISIDEQLIKLARVRVAQQGTSLSAKVRELLQQYVNGTDDATQRQRQEATASLMSAIESATQPPPEKTGPQGAGETTHKTLREELYADDFRARDRTKSAITANDHDTPADQP